MTDLIPFNYGDQPVRVITVDGGVVADSLDSEVAA